MDPLLEHKYKRKRLDYRRAVKQRQSMVDSIEQVAAAMPDGGQACMRLPVLEAANHHWLEVEQHVGIPLLLATRAVVATVEYENEAKPPHLLITRNRVE